jgi:hypothetical protein
VPRGRAPRRTARRRRSPGPRASRRRGARSTTCTGRLSNSSFARTTPRMRAAGRSSSEVTIGPRPGTGSRRLAVVGDHERAECLVGRFEREPLALLPRGGSPTARRARTGAHPRTPAPPARRRPRAGRGPAPASTTTNGSGSPIRRHVSSSARAITIPNS